MNIAKHSTKLLIAAAIFPMLILHSNVRMDCSRETLSEVIDGYCENRSAPVGVGHGRINLVTVSGSYVTVVCINSDAKVRETYHASSVLGIRG